MFPFTQRALSSKRAAPDCLEKTLCHILEAQGRSLACTSGFSTLSHRCFVLFCTCRCSHVVTDRHGICRYCSENAFQCRHCRNINYENPDAFICGECGYSRYGKFEFSVTAAPSSQYPCIQDAEDLKHALKHLDSCREELERRMMPLDLNSQAVVESLTHIGKKYTKIMSGSND